jgi:hypothetical protein
MKNEEMTAAIYRFTKGTNGCSCTVLLPIESDRGLPRYSLLQVTFTGHHHSLLNLSPSRYLDLTAETVPSDSNSTA